MSDRDVTWAVSIWTSLHMQIPTSTEDLLRARAVLVKHKPDGDGRDMIKDMSRHLRELAEEARERREDDAQEPARQEYREWVREHQPDDEAVAEILGYWIAGRGAMVGDVARVKALRARSADWPEAVPTCDPAFPTWARADIDEWAFNHPEAVVRDPATTVLTVADVARYLSLSVRTVEAYRRDGRLPEATMVGRTPTWTRAQIDAWQANRPGQGARTDLRPKH